MQIHNVSKTCCFIGHRKIPITNELKIEIYKHIEHLILHSDVKVFLFGSRSDLDFLCHEIVTELKEKYPYIKRIRYTCRNETVILESERIKWEELYSRAQKRKVRLQGVEEEFKHKTKYTSGRASYIERNQAMVDDSEYCLFYYDETYTPSKRKHAKRSIGYYIPKSGTAVAYKYAKRKNKHITNFHNK